MSSGMYVTSEDRIAYCRVCEYEGFAEVFIDTEVPCYYWDCPMCKHEHDNDGVPDLEEALFP